MEAKVHDANWDSTSSIYKTIDKKWEETKKVLMLILDHEEMEKINLTLRKIEKFISIEDKSLTLGEIATLKYLFSHVEEKESLSLKNIF
jgi:predicted RNA-binding protein with RPS1 domain